MFWRWFAIWVLLLLASAGYLWYRGRGLWGRTKALGREIAEAQERLEAVHVQLERLEEHPTEHEQVHLAIFRDPLQLHLERLALKEHNRAAKLERRRRTRPGWARRALHEDQFDDAVQPDATQPDTVQPDTVQPDAPPTGAVQPDAPPTGAVQPDGIRPAAGSEPHR